MAWYAFRDLSDQILIDCAIHLDARSPSYCMHAFVRSGHASRARPVPVLGVCANTSRVAARTSSVGLILIASEVGLDQRVPRPILPPADAETLCQRSRALFEITLDPSRPGPRHSWEAPLLSPPLLSDEIDPLRRARGQPTNRGKRQHSIESREDRITHCRPHDGRTD